MSANTFNNIHEIQRSSIPRDYRKDVYYTFFSKNTISYISDEITMRLKGVHPDGKNIIVSNEKIISVMDSIYKSTYRDVDKMVMMTISYIVDYISNEFQTERQNNNLNIWIGSRMNDYGMNYTPKIKLREKRPTPFIFNMNY
jgi:hypothetical protein